ncbi:hypothetical protein TeGR_g12565, partial [Tetraparma gracilis]
ELGITGLLFEDAPALVLNAAVLLLKLGAGEEGGEEGGEKGGEKGKLTTYLSFAAFAFSCAMAGRKLGMPGQRKELYEEKLHIEMALNKKKGRVEVGAERKGVRDMFASMKKLATVRPAAAAESVEEGRVSGQVVGGGEGGGSLRTQLEQAIRREEVLRAKANEADTAAAAEKELREKAEQEISVLRKRVRGAEGGE